MTAVATTIEIVVRSTDLSADGHVSVASYVNFFEQARLDHLRNLGVHYRPAAGDFAIATTSLQFLAPAFYPDTLTVETRSSDVGSSSFRLSYELRSRGGGGLVCRGDSTQVWLGGRGRPTPLPDWLVTRLRLDPPSTPGVDD